jgi:hypothetical protein
LGGPGVRRTQATRFPLSLNRCTGFRLMWLVGAFAARSLRLATNRRSRPPPSIYGLCCSGCPQIRSSLFRSDPFVDLLGYSSTLIAVLFTIALLSTRPASRMTTSHIHMYVYIYMYIYKVYKRECGELPLRINLTLIPMYITYLRTF